MAADPIAHALDALRDDVEQLDLAGADAVRHRGERRQRRQRAAAAAGAVAAVAVVATGVGLLQGTGAPHTAPPAGRTLATSAPVSTTVATAVQPDLDGGPRPRLRRAAPRGRWSPSSPRAWATSPPPYFLPGQLWQGPDLNDGRSIMTMAPRELEGRVGNFDCDPDVTMSGDVALLQAKERSSGRFVGTQKVRLLDAGSADGHLHRPGRRDGHLPGPDARRRHRRRRQPAPGETAPVPNATVVEDRASRLDDATGSLRVFKTTTDMGTGAGSKSIEYVVLAREGSAITSVAVRRIDGSQVTFACLRRIGAEAREQLRWAAAQ